MPCILQEMNVVLFFGTMPWPYIYKHETNSTKEIFCPDQSIMQLSFSVYMRQQRRLVGYACIMRWSSGRKETNIHANSLSAIKASQLKQIN
jgi:hypothetical protein